MSNFELSIHFFLQLAILLAVCRVVGLMAKAIGQPQVVAEMIAGVLLGPSLLGAFFPETMAWVFPPNSVSMSILYAVAQVGLVLYMFCVGLEFRVDLLRDSARTAISISVAGMVAPFALGALLALMMYGDRGLFAEGTSRGQAVLFMGAAMSITAFPMLARIIYERGLTGTRVGTLSLAAGSIDDACAWCILAIVLASFKSDPKLAAFAIGGGALYAIVAFTLLRPLLGMLAARAARLGRVDPVAMAITLLLLMLAAWYTDVIGIYAVFGAFVLGACMPRGLLADGLRDRIEPLTTTLLLPLFFVYSGLNTRLTLVDSWPLLLLAGGVLLAAIAGKGLACGLAARFHGMSTRDSVVVGALMNARGLMELIILNIGLEKGLITPTLFSIMVLMAVVTTLMATPIFELARRGAPRAVADPPAAAPA